MMAVAHSDMRANSVILVSGKTGEESALGQIGDWSNVRGGKDNPHLSSTGAG